MIININEKLMNKKSKKISNPTLDDAISLLKGAYGTCGLSISVYNDESDIEQRTGLYLEDDIGFYVHKFININPDNSRLLKCEKQPFNEYIEETIKKYRCIQVTNGDSECLIKVCR